MSVGVMEDYKLRDLRASHTRVGLFILWLVVLPGRKKKEKIKREKILEAGTAVCYQHTARQMMTNSNAGWVLLVFLALVCTGSL